MNRDDYRKILWMFFCFGFVGCLHAQWKEDFSGDLSAWRGDTPYFSCEEGVLCSRGPEQSSSLALSRAVPGAAALPDSAYVLEFGIDLGFVPSGTNGLRLYLLCTDTLLRDTARALYLHLGQKGSQNYWQLWESCADSASLLWQGSKLFSKQSQMKMRVRAEMDSFWRFYVEDPSDLRMKSDGDSVRLPQIKALAGGAKGRSAGGTAGGGLYAGLRCDYRTASRATLYRFSHVYAQAKADYTTETQDRVDGFDGTGLDKFLDSLAAVPPAFGSVVINEVMFEPASGESRFVEIFNRSDSLFSLRNWFLGVEGTSGGNLKYIPLRNEGEILLAGGAYRVFAKDAAKVSSASLSACRENIFTLSGFPTLDNEEGKLRLVYLSAADSLVCDTVLADEVLYSVQAHHWLLSDTKGVSLERLDPAASGLLLSNWLSAAETAGFSTPGCENSHRYVAPRIEGKDLFECNPPLVTPDNDGTNDFTQIAWDGRVDGFLCTMTVYDGAGRKIKQLCTDMLLGSGGSLRYDAVDENGRILRPGIYLILIELQNPKGKIKRLRLPLAVA